MPASATASIPVWVPAVFIALVLLGYRQSVPRTIKPAMLAAVALAMFGFSLYGIVSAFGPQPLALLLWATGYAAVMVFGARYLAPRGLARAGTSVRIPGSWVPLMLLLAIFAAKFVLGFAAGAGLPLLHEAGFIAAVSGVLGALSGGFGVRAVAVHRYAATAGAAA